MSNHSQNAPQDDWMIGFFQNEVDELPRAAETMSGQSAVEPETLVSQSSPSATEQIVGNDAKVMTTHSTVPRSIEKLRSKGFLTISLTTIIALSLGYYCGNKNGNGAQATVNPKPAPDHQVAVEPVVPSGTSKAEEPTDSDGGHKRKSPFKRSHELPANPDFQNVQVPTTLPVSVELPKYPVAPLSPLELERMRQMLLN